MKRWQIATAALVVTGVLGAVWYWQNAAARTEVTVDAAAKVPHPAAATAAGKAQPDAQGTGGDAYALDYSFEMTAPFANAADQTLHLHVTGTLELGAAQPDADGAWQPARLVAGHVEQDAVAARVLDWSLPGVEAELARPFAFHLQKDGRVDAVRCDPTLAFATRSTLAGAAWAIQHVHPATAAATWQLEERDANGTYQAKYRQAAAGVVEKTWQIGQNGDDPARLAQVSNGSARYAVNAHGLETMTWALSGTAATGSLDPAKYKPFALKIGLTRTGAVDAAWAATIRPEALQPFTSASAKVRQRLEAPTRPLDTVLADVAQKAEHLDPSGHVTLRDELTRAVRQDADGPAKLAAQLRQDAAPGEARRLAVEALIGARTEPAQEMAAQLMADETLAQPVRQELLAAAAFMSSPTVAFVTSLEKLAYNPRASTVSADAATTLGAAVAFLAEKNPQAARPVLERLIANAGPVLGRPTAKHAQPLAVRMAWLAGLGNTGDAATLSLILQALGDKDEFVRGAAALALRRQDPAAVATPLIDRMAIETSAHTRARLVDAARFLGPDKLGELVEKALRYDRSEHVRLAAAYAMTVWSTAAPGLRKTLVDALKHEKSPKVAAALQHDINQGQVDPGVAVKSVHMGGAGATP